MNLVENEGERMRIMGGYCLEKFCCKGEEEIKESLGRVDGDML